MTRQLTQEDYAALAEVRYQIRRFLTFSERKARASGIEPQQHQLLLALRGMPDSTLPTIGVVAERLQIRHHSAVELVSRSVERGLVRRVPGERDRRQVTLVLEPRGRRLLATLSRAHHSELRSKAPALLQALLAIVASEAKPRARRPSR